MTAVVLVVPLVMAVGVAGTPDERSMDRSEFGTATSHPVGDATDPTTSGRVTMESLSYYPVSVERASGREDDAVGDDDSVRDGAADGEREGAIDADPVTEAPDCSTVDYETDGGTKLVGTVEQLQCISEDPDADYRLVADVDATGTAEWNDGAGFTPIDEFTGTLDGDGHAIAGLTVDREDRAVGLFESIRGGTVTDLRLQAVDMETLNGGGGALAGGCRHCVVRDVHVVAGRVTGLRGVGGLVGELRRGSIRRSSVDLHVSASGPGAVTAEHVGGLVAYAYRSAVARSYAVVTVRTDGPSNVGGLVGESHYSSVTGSYTTGTVEANAEQRSGARNVGGLVGYNNRSTVRSAYATVRVSGARNVGGLVGNNRGDAADYRTRGGQLVVVNAPLIPAIVRDTFARGTVTGSLAYNASARVGGLVGHSGPKSRVITSYSTGAIDGGDESNVQGSYVGLLGSFAGPADRPVVEYGYFETDERKQPAGIGRELPADWPDGGDEYPPMITNVRSLAPGEMRGESAASTFHDAFAFGSNWTTGEGPDDYPRPTNVVEGHHTPRPYYVADLRRSKQPNGTHVTLVVFVDNRGRSEADRTVELRIDADDSGTFEADETRASRSLDADCDRCGRLEFTVPIGDLDGGTYDVAVSTENATRTGEVTIEGYPPVTVEVDPHPSDPDDDTVRAGEETRIGLRIENANTGEGVSFRDVSIPELGVDGSTDDFGGMNVAVTFDEPGEYELTVAVEKHQNVTVTLTVVDPADADGTTAGDGTETDGETQGGSGPGFTAAGAVLALLVVVLAIAARRR